MRAVTPHHQQAKHRSWPPRSPFWSNKEAKKPTQEGYTGMTPPECSSGASICSARTAVALTRIMCTPFVRRDR